VLVETISGEWGIYESQDIAIIDKPLARSYLKMQDFEGYYPIFVDSLLLFADKEMAKIRDIKLFKAVCKGRGVDIDKTVR